MSSSEYHSEQTKRNWSSIESLEALAILNTDSNSGLSENEAEQRLKLFGLNMLTDSGTNPWYMVLVRQFTSVLIWVLIAAAILSYFVGEVGDTFTILAIILLNGALGFFQEWKAEQALDALKKMLAPSCTVVRNSIQQTIEASTLVPGDIVVLKAGDMIPADIRIIQSLNLRSDESSLTGEVNPVNKSNTPVEEATPLSEKSSMLWMGTVVTEGRGTGVVADTGMNTEFGHIAKLTSSVETEDTPLQKRFAVLGTQLGVFSIGISALVGLFGWVSGKPAVEMFMTAVSLAVAVVPEGLPAVVTITLALGIRSMVKKNALIRRLQATETLGSASVICTDKTGTLTRNEMTVQKIYTAGMDINVTGLGYDPAGHMTFEGTKLDPSKNSQLLLLLETAYYCNHASIRQENGDWSKTGEPTEAALVTLAYKGWLNKHSTAPEIIREIPFTSERKKMSILVKRNGKHMVMAKGAPEVLINSCDYIYDGNAVRAITDDDLYIIEEKYNSLAKNGLRTLALGFKDVDSPNLCEEEQESNLVFLGVTGIIDPPRKEVASAIELTKTAGIKTIMITGDSPVTAAAIAARIGLPSERVITGQELDEMPENELAELVSEKVIFARTTPAHKLRIVEALQKKGQVVSMTGDGVNDAPALKKADIGISMGIRGTDVAKGASEMILLDDNYASILNAIEEGRRQYTNIQKFVRYLLSSNVGEIVAIFLNIIMNAPLILLPVQILWMNLVTDGVTALALGLEPVEKGTMNQPPRPASENILNKSSVAIICALGAYMGVATLLLFQFNLHKGDDYARTMAFTGLIMLEKANIFNFRAFKTPLKDVGLFTNPWLIAAVASMFALQLAAVYTPFLNNILHTVPISLNDWITIFAAALPIFIIPEVIKTIKHKKQK